MRLTATLAAAALTLVLGIRGAYGQTASPQDLEALREQIADLAARQQAIERQLQEVKALLQAQGKPASPPPAARLNVEGAPSRGDAGARITIVEFADYECPFCSRYARETWPLLEKDYVKTGKVKYVFRNFPIPALHKQAVKAHEAALCAGEQGKYWEMHDLLFANAPKLGQTALLEYGGQAGVELNPFHACLNSGKHLPRIQQDVSEAQRAGMTGTPTFFLGLTPSAGEPMEVVHVLKGAQPYGAFRQAIEAMLTAAAALPVERQ